VDATARGEPTTRVCNFAQQQFPMCITPAPTLVVMQGVIEYVAAKADFMRAFRCAYRRATMLLSYRTHPHQPGMPPLEPVEVITQMFAELELEVVNATACQPKLQREKCWELRPRLLSKTSETCRQRPHNRANGRERRINT
jgi:hypothetical protein